MRRERTALPGGWRSLPCHPLAIIVLQLCFTLAEEGQAGSCSSPIHVAPPATFSLDPCTYSDSTASSNKDAVMLISPSNTSKQISVETSGADTELFAYTSCPDTFGGPSQVAHDDYHGPGAGSKITFVAASWASYYVVLEPDFYSTGCGNVSITFGVTELPDRGSCGSPILLDPPASLVLNPCDLWDSTASSSSDAVMLVSAADTSRQLTVITSGADTELSVFTQCPDSVGGSSQVANNNDGGPNQGSKVVFTAAASTSYYVVLEPDNSWDCGNTRVEVLGPPPAGLGTCSDPLPVEPPASFALNPCDYVDSTASSDDDAVMLIGPSSTPRVITVETLGADTRLFSYTSCPSSANGKVVDNDNGGPGLGSKIAFVAQTNMSYFIVLEPDYDYSDCGIAGIIFDAVELPRQSGSCSDPIPVEPPATLTNVYPCASEDSTASSSKDAVMLIAPSDTLRVITVETFSSDAALHIFTSCPDKVHGNSQVAYDKLDGSGSGSKITFAARASESYYIAMEDSSDDCSVSSVAFNVTKTLDASELPRQEGTCSFPIRVDPPASFSLDPCSYSHSTASSNKDAVMLISPSNTSRQITVESSGADTELRAYTFCPDSAAGSSRVAHDDNGGPGLGSKITFIAVRGASYYIVLEPDYSSDCGDASITFDVTDLPDQGSCGSPILLDPPASLVLNPCDLWDSTASSSSDAVMLISAADTSRQLTVITSGTDTEVYVFTQCPDSVGGSSQVANNNDGGPNQGSKVVFTAAASTSYYVVLELHNSYDCGDTRVEVLGPPPSGLGTCSDPFPVKPPASFALNPCDYVDSTASSDDDAVMLIGPSSTPRVITVETLGADTRLFSYTSCPDSQYGSSKIADNDNGGPDLGSKIAFPAQADVSYFIVLEPDYDYSDCGTAGITFDAVELPRQNGSCSDPIPVEPPATLTNVYPCASEDSTASSSKDAVMLIAPSDTLRVITVETFSSDAALYIFTSCPDKVHGNSQVAYDKLDGSGSGSKIFFAARASESYYIAMEDSSDDCSVSSVAFNVTETLDASELPRQEGTCSFPIRVDPPASFSLDPCTYSHSTASSNKDAVMLIGPSNTSRQITVETSGADTELRAYTSCPDSSAGSSRIAYNDNGGPGLGSKITFTAASWASYYVVLEPDYSSSCGNTSITFEATVLPDRGSCGSPIYVDPPASLVLNPCDLWDSTASSSSDAVMLISASDTSRQLAVITSGTDTEVYVFTQCPDSVGGSSQVANNDDGGPNWGSKVVFTAAASTSYYVVLEPHNSYDCGDARVEVLGPPPAGLGTCSDPLPVEPPASFALNPCDYVDSTASSDDDAVMLIGPSSTPRVMTVETLGADTRLFSYTLCPDSEHGTSKVTSNDNGGPDLGSKIAFVAQANVSYFVVLEPDYAYSDCGTAGVIFNSTELPWQRGSCTDPIPVEPPSTLTQVFPCAYGNSTASSSKDAVMLISPSDALRVITVETFTSDAALYIYSSCPEEEHGATQVAYDKLDGSGSGSKISFAARASESYYIAMEDSSDDCSVSSVAFNVTETLDASELPRQEGTCSFPIRVDPPASFVLDICAYSHSTASSKKDAVMFIGPSNSTRRITVEASGLDTELYAFSFCPETSAGSIQVAYDDDGGSGTGSMMTFTAERSRPYYIVLEPYYSYACSNASVAFDVTELPGHGSCDAPLHLDPPASLVLNPCDLWDSTASSSSDAVMLISAADMERELTVITSGTDTEVYIFTQCPDSADGSSQIAYDDDGGPNTGSKVVFTAAPSTQYYVVLEPYSSSSCGDASVDVLLNPSQGSGSCSNPFPVDPPAAFALNPCDYGDSTASSDGDAVMLIGPSSTPRIITVETLGADTRLYAFTSCPDIEDGASQVAQNDAGGAGSGSKILIHAQANVSFFIVVELDSPDCKTAGAYFDAFELPWQSASCSAPIPVEPPATLTQVYPCAYDNSTASSSRDVVMLISPSDSARQITVISSQIDTQLYVFTQCPDSEDGSSQVAHNDDGGPGTGSRVTFFAESQKGYYAVLEPYSSSVCGNASVTFEATELPEQGSEEASCSSPIRLSLDPSTSLSLSPCMYEQSAASPEKDAVMLISPSDSPREVTVVSTQMDTELYVYTHCPDSEGGPSQVAYDDDSGPDTGSKVVFTAEPLTSYYVILEPYSPSECGNASVDVTEVPASVPPPLQDACEDPQSVNLDQYGDFYTASFDSCTGNVAKLAPFSSQRTIRVAVTPEQDGVSSDFFVSEFCLQAQDGRSTVDITQNSDGNQFVAASDKAYFVALGGDSSTCGPVKLYIEFLNVLLLGSQRQAGCGSISPLALNDTGTIFINNINFCDQEDSSGGTLANYDLGRRRDFVIALAPSPVSSRQIQVTVNDLPSGTRPILLASKKCSGHTQDDVLAWFDPSGDSSDSVDITFTASAGVQLYIVLESPDADQCGPQGQVQISCLSADPSLPALGRTGIRRIGMELRIDTNFNELTRTSEQIKAFKKDVSNSLARGLHTLQPELLELEDSPQDICLSCVRVGDLAQGSVIAPITILLRDDEQKGKIKEFARQINDVDTRSLIEDSSYSDQAIAHSVSVEPADSDEVSPPPSSKQPNPPPSSKQPNPPPSSKQPNQPNDGSSGDNGGDGSSNASVIGPAVGVPVGVVFLLVLLVPLIYWACKHRRMEPGLMPGPAPELSSFRHEPVPTGPPPLSPRPGPSGPPRPAAPPPPRPPPSPPRAAAPPPPRPPPSPPRAAAPPPPRPPPSLPRSSAELSPQAFPPWPPSAPSPPPRPSPGAPTHPAPPTAPSWPEFAEPAPRPPQPEMPPASTFQPASLADLPPIYYPHRIDNPLHVGTPAIDPTEPIAPPIVPPDSARPGPRSPPGLVDNPIGEEEILPLYEPSPLPEIQQNQPLPGEECLVCLDGPRQYGFLHSGTLHLGVCQECASHIRRGSACMVCRGTIEHIIRVHS